MKIVRTELREGRNVFLWQGGAYLNPKEFVKDTSHSNNQETTHYCYTHKILVLGCPKLPHR